MNRKTVVIVLVVQTALMLYSFLYGYIQESIVREQEMIAKENERRAVESMTMAHEIQKKCENELEKLSISVKELENELSNCKKK